MPVECPSLQWKREGGTVYYQQQVLAKIPRGGFGADY
jgi:hypothetical protein